MSWTDERVDLLKKMWAEGKSASQIAKELGSVTRNAVIGKVHRLGLASRTAGEAETPAPVMPEKASGAPDAAATTPMADEILSDDPVGTHPSAQDASVAPVAEWSEPVDDTAAPQDKTTVPAADAQARDEVTPEGAAATTPAPEAADDETIRGGTATGGTVVVMPNRRPIVPAGQPLPPQPSANEISPEALANVREIEKGARKLTLMELTERTCKWPIGDPATDDFWFCGLPVAAGKPYCEGHVSVAFQPMQARRDRRR